MIWQAVDGGVYQVAVECLQTAPMTCTPTLLLENSDPIFAISPDAQTFYGASIRGTSGGVFDSSANLTSTDVVTGESTIISGPIDTHVIPALSPDGRWIAVSQPHASDPESFVLQVIVDAVLISTETGEAQVIASSGISEFSWSRDSRQLAIESADGEFLDSAIWVYDLDSENLRQLSPTGSSFYSPHWRTLPTERRETGLFAAGLGIALMTLGLWRRNREGLLNRQLTPLA